MKTRKITVRIGPDSTREVRALIYGPFAIHRTLYGLSSFDGHYYTVSHVATGYATATDARSKASALKLARMLVRCGVDWSFTTAVAAKSLYSAREAVARWWALDAKRKTTR